ncbi:transglycosylase SLT domain-containing protein [Clostridium oceanicum]|uniref:Transglycosylase SLT domain-containing protein n=1 Tax=Clostridium oceanicum TaxID=1543 RepID=A0ABP3UL99_9CLOT
MKKIIALIVIAFIIVSGYIVSSNYIYPVKYQDSLKKYSKKYNIDVRLLASIIYTESGFRDLKYEKGKPSGLTQMKDKVIDNIAKEMGMKDFKIEQIENPEIAIKMTSWYLKNKCDDNSKDLDKIIRKWALRNRKNKSEEEINSYIKMVKRTKGMYKIFHLSL